LRRITVALLCAGPVTFTALYAIAGLPPSLSAAFHLSPTATGFAVSVGSVGLEWTRLVRRP